MKALFEGFSRDTCLQKTISKLEEEPDNSERNALTGVMTSLSLRAMEHPV